MKRFFFSLEKLLDLRSFEEREAELTLGKAISERDRVSLLLDEIARKRVKATGERRGALSISDLTSIERYVTRLDGDRDKRLEELAVCELAIERARAAYIEASKKRKVLSKLRDKKAEAWKKDGLREEAETIDDIVNSRRANT